MLHPRLIWTVVTYCTQPNPELPIWDPTSRILRFPFPRLGQFGTRAGPQRDERRSDGPFLQSGSLAWCRMTDSQTPEMTSPQPLLRPRAYPGTLSLGLRLERLLKVLDVDARPGSPKRVNILRAAKYT